MNLAFISLKENPTLGAGYVTLQFRSNDLFLQMRRCSIQRIGHQESHLGPHGWQTPTHLFDARDIAHNDYELSFVLEPWAVHHMRNAVNYRITLHDNSDAELGFAIVHWRGVPSFRARKNSTVSLVQTEHSNERDVKTDDTAIEKPFDPEWTFAVTDGAALLPESQKKGAELPVQPAGDSWIANNENEEGENGSSDVKANTEEPIRAIPCPHDASHKIFSNMVCCPICGKAV